MKSIVGMMLLAIISAPTSVAAATPEEERADIRKTADATLARLYKAQPSAKQTVAKAAGYAVFNNFGMKILVAGGGSGHGIAVDNKTRKPVYMKMVEIQAGLGFGVKKFSLVWVFDTKEAFDQFVNSGWELGGQGSMAAKAGDKGGAMQGAMSVAPGVWLYQLTDAGLALELTAKGTKYYKDTDLN